MNETSHRLRQWAGRRWAPICASGALVALALCFIPYWTHVAGTTPSQAGGWFIPGDLWGTQLAARAVTSGHLNEIYSDSTGLVTFPAVAVLLSPAVALDRVLDWVTLRPGASPINSPAGWLPIMAITIVSALPVLFASDALADALDVSQRHRFVLAGFQAVAVWNVVLWWGHPEDALAVAFLLFGAHGALAGKWRGAAWLLGVGVAFQPLVLLALPILAAMVPAKARLACALRLAAPSVLVVIGPLLVSWHATIHALVRQPNFPTVDHSTPWTAISPALAGHQVAAGPLRLGGLLVVAVGGWWIARRVTQPQLLLWLMALALSSRLLFEPVMVAYYVWPALCLGLVAVAQRSWRRFLVCGILATVATVFGDAKWQGNWSWWAVETALMVLFLWAAWPGTASAVEFGAMNGLTEMAL